MLFKKATLGNPLSTLDHLRLIRKTLLQESDWTQASDSPLTNAKKTEWATYRQQLRDLPASYSNEDSINDVVFPSEPS
tara:strand:+ start:1176 stop:1409 length:234 start_codon:yes stop_codon:yes gene_type:complete